jgi:hypothetical protein
MGVAIQTQQRGSPRGILLRKPAGRFRLSAEASCGR